MTSSSPATPASRAASVLRATARYASREASSDVGHLPDFGDDLAAAEQHGRPWSWEQMADSLRSLADDLEAEHSELRLVSDLLDVYEIPSTSPGPASLRIPLEGRVLLLAEQLAGDIASPWTPPSDSPGPTPSWFRAMLVGRRDVMLDVLRELGTAPPPGLDGCTLDDRVGLTDLVTLWSMVCTALDRPERPPALTQGLQGLHPAVSHLLDFFHRSDDGSDVSEAFLTIARRVAVCGGPEATVALRKLLEAQDATSRARSVAS